MHHTRVSRGSPAYIVPVLKKLYHTEHSKQIALQVKSSRDSNTAVDVSLKEGILTTRTVSFPEPVLKVDVSNRGALPEKKT